MKNSNNYRNIEEVLVARATSDGDGVVLKRVFGGGNLARFDPFLMLDEFGSDQPTDYIGGFPPHPHRGFQTMTFMLAGNMEHKDHMGNVGRLGAGDVQWMSVGAGVIHSEMPQQEEGLMRGFQLWINLPSKEKMTPATYKDISAEEIPEYRIGDVIVKSIAGKLSVSDKSVEGFVKDLSTEPAILDVRFKQSTDISINVDDGHTALVYVYEGQAQIGDEDFPLEAGKLARLSTKGVIKLSADKESRVLVMTGNPIKEPIVQQGPFVMNTQEEIQIAIREYSEGTFV